MSYSRKALGNWGEETAKQYLIDKGYFLLDQNWRTQVGELDLIMLDRGIVVFIEVRTKSTSQFGTAIESINYKKQQKLLVTAQSYLQRKKWWNRTTRFDLVTIDKIKGNYQIEHLKNIIQ